MSTAAVPLGQEPEPAQEAAGPVPRPGLVRRRGPPHAWLVRTARALGRFLFPRCFTLRVYGAEHVPLSGPVLLAGNHTSFLDGPLVWVLAPRVAQFYIKE